MQSRTHQHQPQQSEHKRPFHVQRWHLINYNLRQIIEKLKNLRQLNEPVSFKYQENIYVMHQEQVSNWLYCRCVCETITIASMLLYDNIKRQSSLQAVERNSFGGILKYIPTNWHSQVTWEKLIINLQKKNKEK